MKHNATQRPYIKQPGCDAVLMSPLGGSARIVCH